MGMAAHLEFEFDTMGSEPDPWWRPFAWYRAYIEENGHWQRVVRFGVLGVHLGISIAYSPEELSDRKE